MTQKRIAIRPSTALATLVTGVLIAIFSFTPTDAWAAKFTRKAPEKSATAAPAAQQAATSEDSDASVDAQRLFRAIVKVHTRAVPDARSSATLGQEREGSGIVIGPNGLILTIGYLIVEADDVKVTDSHGHAVGARIVGYDHASGLGLVRTVTPLDAAPVPLGESAKVAEQEPVMIVSNGGADEVTLAYIVARRPFTGSWEYMLDQAIFTSPPTMNWSGAALVDRDGKLLGVGSLIVRDVLEGEQSLPGNMFVPIDELKPVLADLVKNGKRSGPARPWLGVSAEEQHGRLFVTRVSPDGPGDTAGIRAGDIILAVGSEGVRTQAEFYRNIWSRGPAGTVIPLRVLQGIDIKEVSVRSIDRVEYFRPITIF